MIESWDRQKIARTALILAIAAISVWMLWRFLPALAWAVVLAIATWPLRQMLMRRGFGKSAAASVLTLVLAVVLILPLIWLGIQAAHESGVILEWINDVRQNGLGTPPWLAHVPYIGSSLASWWQENLAEPGAPGTLIRHANTPGVVTLTRTLGLEVAHRVTILVFTLLTLFFLYRDGDGVMDEAHAIANRVFGPAGGQLGKDAVTAVRGTVNGLVLVGLAEGVILGIAYAATGLSHAALFGLITAMLATVPFGAPVVFIACALYLFATSHATAAIALIVTGV
ncbi:MAG: AI-2E family transporter, partial [Betaproteobacteria bacterium]|nr:AI-2E family transporter [Betaproteobacteria bacterium]